MRANKRKIRLFAFSSIVWQQAGPPEQTLWARWILPLSALERLENLTRLPAPFCLLRDKIHHAQWMPLVSPDPIHVSNF
jgi:hypothetical protein